MSVLVRNYNPVSGPVDGPTVVREMGLTNLPADLPQVGAIPIVNITNFQTISQIDFSRPAEMIYQWQNNLSWIKGRHTLKFGGEIWHNYGSNFGVSPSRAYGSVSFTGAYSGFSYADFILGIPRQASRSSAGFVKIKSTNWDQNFFIQDDFKATRRLTINVGLRYEYNPPYVEREDRNYNFNPFTGQMVVPTAESREKLFPGFLANNLVPIVTAQQANLPARRLAFADRNNFAPRFGFAYKLTSDNRTVLRGAYGIFYDSFTAALWRTLVGGPYNGSESTPINVISGGRALWMWPDMFPRTLNQVGTAAMAGVDPRMRLPYTQQWTMTLEREFWNMGWRASYVGSKTHRLSITRDLNQLQPSTLPFSVSRRPYPQLSTVTYRENAGNAYYNALIASVERKYKAGLQYQVNYTWAKNLTDSHNEGEGGGSLQNAYDRRAEWGNHQFTRRHRMTVNSIWDLPFGRGQKLARSGVLSYLFGGWSLSTFGILQTGAYFTPTFSTFDPANIGAGGGRPDRIGSGRLSQPNYLNWFDSRAFRVPGDLDGDNRPDVNVGRFGNSGVNILRGPGTKVLNAGLFKRFQVREGYRLQAEATFTNVLNHTNFGVPIAVIDNPAAGRVTATQTLESAGPRTTRFGLRLDF